MEPLPHGMQELRQASRLLRVEPGRRLVEKKQPRTHRQRSGDLDAPLDSRRQVGGERARVAVELEHVEDRASAFPRCTLRVCGEGKVQGVAERVAPAECIHRHDQVFLNGHRAPELQVLKCPRDAKSRSYVGRRVNQ